MLVSAVLSQVLAAWLTCSQPMTVSTALAWSADSLALTLPLAEVAVQHAYLQAASIPELETPFAFPLSW